MAKKTNEPMVMIEANGNCHIPGVHDRIAGRGKANIASRFVVITHDKLRLLLADHLACIQSREKWIAPASLFAAILTTLVSSNFKDSLYVKAPVWEAIYYIAAALSLLWLGRNLLAIAKSRSVQDFIDAADGASEDADAAGIDTESSPSGSTTPRE